jgi:ribosomal protein L37E
VARPNYKKRCLSCGARPTVELEDADGVHSLMLCGPCTFGEARMRDPHEWNKA